MQGTVKWFNAQQKGYGFIIAPDGKEVFVHHSNIKMDGFWHLDKNDIVNFEIGAGKDGREQAIDVKPILTLAMVLYELKKDKLHLMRIGDDKGIHGWYVVDKSDHPVIDKEMDLIGLAEYIGFEIRQLSA